MRSFTLILCVFFGTIYPAWNQVTYRFKNISIEDGLSQSSINSIVQDDIGTLWLGTQDGLNRYDGEEIEVYTSDDTPGLSSSYIYCSLKDRLGNLWFGTSDGLSVFVKQKEQFFSLLNEENKNISIESITEAPTGNIWLGSSTHGLIHVNASTYKTTFSNTGIPSKKIHFLKYIGYNQLLVSFEDKGLYVYNIKDNQWIKLNLNQNQVGLISSVESFNTAHYILTSNNGLWLFNPKTHHIHSFLPVIKHEFGITEFSDVYVKSEHELFIGTTNSGLITAVKYGDSYRLSLSKKDVYQKNSLQFNEINRVFGDQDGTIWIGTLRGLSGFKPENNGFFGVGTSSNLENSLPSESVWGFSESSDLKKMYVATDFAISEIDKKTGLFTHYYIAHSQDNNDKSILCFYQQNDHSFLVGTNGGLYALTIEFGKGTYTKINYKNIDNPTIFNKIFKIIQYKENSYFLATKGGVLLYNSITKEVQPFVHDAANPSNTIGAGNCRVAYRGLDNTYFFTAGVGGIYLLDSENGTLQIKPYQFNDEILKASRDLITSIYQETKNVLWLGTSGSGLIRLNLKSGAVRRFTRKQGLPNNFVYGILPDKSGNLWLSTNQGLCKFNLVNEICTNYTEASGLMSNEFNTGAYMLSQTGILFFGGIEGYNYFNPIKLEKNNEKITIQFYKFRFEENWLSPLSKNAPFKESFSVIDHLYLKYNQRSFTIRFIVSDIINRDVLQFKYEMVGLNEGKVFLGNSSEIHFTSLNPGKYTLNIYVRKLNGQWVKAAKRINIEVEAPFWWRWWFWILVLFFITIIIVLFIRSRINIAKRDQVRLEMKIVERTKEIRAQNIKIEAQKKELEKEKKKVEEQKKLLQIEKDKAESILHNVMPESTAEEIKLKGKVSARAYKTVSVLFTDFVGFSKAAEGLTPTELVNRLDVYFSKFDEIIVRNNLEKIKTIGDAYMCAGGVPVRNNTNPIDAVLAALQIQDYMHQLKEEALKTNGEYWDLRLGINTGEVTAGVIGSERLAYDIWGSTVNHAQRMENMGEPGRVTISGNTFKLIEPYFECTYRGKVKTKSKGMIEMFTVERIKPELSINGEGLFPNDKFQQIVNLHLYSSISYYKAERHIIKVLEKGLSPKLHYHSIEHTKDVVRAVERYALLEGVTDEGLFLLKSAATYHDAGFVEQYEKNEPIGARMADEILPKYGYSEQHIAQIKELIFVTQIPHQPKNKLEEIICDADLDYLGRGDFHEIADRLRRELKEHGKIDSDRKWDEMQVAFLNMHKYFTASAIQSRQAKKMQNLKEVEERLQRNEYVD